MTGHNSITLITAAMMIVLSAPLAAESGKGGRPGDEFRHKAAEYDDSAAKAVQQATQTEGKAIGKYLELSAIYREMAAIKRNAASLADQGRWNDIKWNRYQELEGKRDRLLGQAGHKKAKYNNKQDKNKQAGKKQKSGGHDFLKAADRYEQQAQLAHAHGKKASGKQQAVYQELAGIYQDMANIKREAAAAAQAGKGYNWNTYKRLAQRRDQLKQGIKHAKK